MKKYEVHLTFTGEWDLTVEDRARAEAAGWKHSVMEGDPVLGKGRHEYLTTHTEEYDSALRRIVTFLMECQCSPPARAKIEQDLNDWRAIG